MCKAIPQNVPLVGLSSLNLVPLEAAYLDNADTGIPHKCRAVMMRDLRGWKRQCIVYWH